MYVDVSTSFQLAWRYMGQGCCNLGQCTAKERWREELAEGVFRSRLCRHCFRNFEDWTDMVMGQNPVPLVNIKIAGKWVFTPLTLIIIGFDTHPYVGQSRLCFVVGLKIQGKLGPKATGSQGKILMLSNTRRLVFHCSLSVFILILQSLTWNLTRA